MTILVTGGAGYIGSHFVRQALKNGYDVAIIDNLSRGHKESVPEGVKLYNVNITDFKKLAETVKEISPDAIVHFAAFAYVGESVEDPEVYYVNNTAGSLNLIRAAKAAGVDKFIFSSTCSLYGNPVKVPISESEPVKPINPYARTKLMIENTLSDFSDAYDLNYVALRYFNAAGADPAGMIGESHDPEPHLIPIVLQVALGKREKVFIFGDDYNTPDGTCIRDYIHVNDLADAHLLALKYLENGGASDIFNLGTGNGFSVKELIDSARKITGKDIIADIADRRPGDPDVLVADNGKAKSVLGWEPEYGLDEIISHAWNWHQNQKY
ncbi:MAG: UDP-glucose 4-epimerase GalE [Melioribacteraceae bacterium]|nr:MAG: UDP-glucose 4-epimerase GalE [Melioribacteraceae bacterium]